MQVDRARRRGKHERRHRRGGCEDVRRRRAELRAAVAVVGVGHAAVHGGGVRRPAPLSGRLPVAPLPAAPALAFALALAFPIAALATLAALAAVALAAALALCGAPRVARRTLRVVLGAQLRKLVVRPQALFLLLRVAPHASSSAPASTTIVVAVEPAPHGLHRRFLLVDLVLHWCKIRARVRLLLLLLVLLLVHVSSLVRLRLALVLVIGLV